MFEVYYEIDLDDIADQLDTSFGMIGTIDYRLRNAFIPVLGVVGEVDEYTFTSSVNQIVTIVLTPEKALDDFDLEVFQFHIYRIILELRIFF